MEPKGLDHWLTWIEHLKKWVHAAPPGIYSNPAYSVRDVAYADLRLLATHFNQQVYPEGLDHCQSVPVQVQHGMSSTVVTFKSPARKFKYAKLL